LEIWEHQAAGLNDGAFDLETFNKMTGGLLLRVYRDYASFIRHIRREDPTIYDQLEVLVDKLIVMRSSGFLIDRKALAGLKQDVLTRAEIARVRKLRSNDEYAFSKLQQALVEIDLDTEKNRITRVTRMKLGRIVALEKSNEGAVVKLFDEIQRATKGKYPPKKLIDSTYGPGIGGIEKWLDRGFESTRFVYILGRNNHVIGHIEIQDLRSISGEDSKKYWERVFSESAEFNNEKKGDRPLRIDDLAIIKRLGVHPDYTRRQIGRQLLRRAIHVIEEELMQVPALVVLEELSPARRLYESEGARLIGAFREETGEQMLSYIF
jgi:GNAT superfamily N-acetyltransferase